MALERQTIREEKQKMKNEEQRLKDIEIDNQNIRYAKVK